MYALMYFDVEDFLSPPDHPVHQLPRQFAEIMEKHGLRGSFHIHGEKVRFMERHNQRSVIEAIRRHDVSLHFDRGSIHPTTGEQVSNLDWFQGVDRVLFRELPGFQTLERVLGKCSALTRHGATFAPQMVYAAGKMGKAFFSSPFQLPGRNVVWYCNNIFIATGEGGSFDRIYRDTPQFDAKLEEQNDHLRRRMGKVDLAPLFGCHPLITIMEEFPCGINFAYGCAPPPNEWKPPQMIEGVSIPTILENFERRIEALANFPGLEWSTTGEIAEMYGRRPVRVSDRIVEEGARAVVEHGGPTFTDALSAGELLCLLARRRLAPASAYDVPQVMGPVVQRPEAVRAFKAPSSLRNVCLEIVEHALGSGYLPECLGARNGNMAIEAALLALACDAVGADPSSVKELRLSVEAIPGVAEACEDADNLRKWRVHGPAFNQETISRHFRQQAWTLKPALRADEYGEGVETGRHLNPALPFAMQGS